MTWCKSVRLVHNWDSVLNYLIGIETQQLFPTVSYWLICRHEQTIAYVIVQTTDPFPQSSISRIHWNNQSFWTMNSQNLSTLQVFQSFSHKWKSLFLQSCPEEFIRFLCECIVNLLKGNLLSMKRHNFTKFQKKSLIALSNKILLEERRDVVASENGLQLKKVITPPVINHLSWRGAACCRSCFCIQQ